MKRIRGCDRDVNPYTIEGFTITRCPRTHITFTDTMYLQAFKEYQAGFLPNPGGWLDQPMKFTTAMSIVERIVSEQGEKNAESRV